MNRRRWSRALLASAALLVAALILPRAVAGQEPAGRIEGTVTVGRTGQPLASVSVFIDGTGIGAQTNDRGRYVLVNVPVGAHEVRVRRIGFSGARKPVTVVAGQVATADFRLNEAAISLEEVVVTGTAATTRAKEVPTSTDIINMQTLERAPVINAQQVLAGRVPSVTIQANSGQPGAGGAIRIRGTNTITQNTDPLIYVDGVRVFNEMTRNNWGARTGSNALQDINPDDIERIEVVKGAAATTLYGTEAAAGVIQIFTKKGQAGAPEWNANLTTGLNQSPRWGDPADPTELFTKCGETANLYSLVTSGAAIGSREYFVDPTCPSDGKWTELGPVQQYDLSVRGGTNRVTYFVSGNYNNTKGILPTQRSRDGGFRGNFAFFPFDQLQLSLNTSYTRRQTRWAGDGNNAEGFLLNVGRGAHGYMFGGKADDCANVPGTATCITNGYVFDQTLTTRSDHFLSGLTINYTPTVKLSNRFAIGWDFTDFNNVTNLPFGFLTLNEGYFWDENSRHTKLSLDYAGSFQSSLFGLGAMNSTFSWGGQLFRDRHRWTEIDVQGFGGPGDPTLTSGAELTYRNDLPSAGTNAGFFFQEQLGWRDRLFLTGGLRVDGNSAFGENFGLQMYPKIGASYVLSDHAFWPTRWWETMKLRAAIGESGKAPGAFDKLRTWSPVSGDENNPGVTPNDVGNSDLGPERTQEIEGGFDAGFLGGRLGFELTAFQARTLDAIVPVTLPPSNGFLVAQKQNVGELRNTGLELQLTGGILRRRNVDWSLRGNMSFLKNEAIDLGEETEIYTGLNSYIKCKPIPNVQPGQAACDGGYKFPAYYGKKVLNPNENAPPIIADDSLIGLVNPDRLWGLGTTLTLWNKLTLDAFFEHQGGFYVQNYTAYQNARRGSWFPCYDIQQQIVASYGPNKRLGGGDDVPSALDGVRALDRVRCAFSGHDIGFWTEPGDFTKLRYVSLTYTLPARLLSANTASLTFSARNLYTWTNYHGTDPEVTDFVDQANLVGTNGAFGRRDYYQIPQSRTFTLSLRVSF